ncbi:MAG: four helix bundle protein [Candidatus Andersenbacteria bacterium]|nr:four helix bundle protein [Candidatus Andersenbacteria bacterium]MBI3251160.1 four helix bundle protein [Candidatus Andersenbacteria bacterium]
MNDSDIPILKKAYELYKTFHEYRKTVPKQDRFTIYEWSERLILDIIENLFLAGYAKTVNKATTLEQISAKLNLLRLLVRLMKDTKTLDNKKYIVLQEIIDEIGRQLGGWSRSIR